MTERGSSAPRVARAERWLRLSFLGPLLLLAGLVLVFDRGSSSFRMSRGDFFAGGAVNVYQAYHGLWF